MKDLLKISQSVIGAENVNSVNARELHFQLEIGKDFSSWIKSQLDSLLLDENKDYLKLTQKGEKKIEYIVTLDAAKHIALSSRTQKGKDLRNYFIQFEKQAKQVMHSQTQEIALMKQMLNTIETTDQRVTKIESNMRIENWQQKRLEQAKNQKVYALAEQHDFKQDATLIKKCHSRVWKRLKDKFNLPRYNELPICEFENGLNFINNLKFSDLI